MPAGKAPLEDDSDSSAAAALAVAAADKAGDQPGGGSSTAAGQGQYLLRRTGQLGRQCRPAFHPQFTLAGTQPQFVLPQVGWLPCDMGFGPATIANSDLLSNLPTITPHSHSSTSTQKVTGDVLRVTTRLGGPTLPGLGPLAAAQRAAEAGRLLRRRLPQEAVEYLLPPKSQSQELASQVTGGWACSSTVLVTTDRSKVQTQPTNKPNQKTQLPTLRRCTGATAHRSPLSVSCRTQPRW
jgi:hypothetical protein